MPGSAILLEATELTESTAVSFKCGLKVRSPWAGVYKISQNLGGILHSLGVLWSPSSTDGREGRYQYAVAGPLRPLKLKMLPQLIASEVHYGQVLA